jgi:hypothetical protein
MGIQQSTTNKTLLSAPKHLSRNKRIPKILENQILTALAHYPELKNTNIRFVFTRKLKSSIMAARPVVQTLLGPRHQRTYEILIKPVFKLRHSIQPIHLVSDEVLIGWIGHELGHIMDYEQRTTLRVAKFGLLYWLSKRYIHKAERVADTFAVNRGMGSYILATKDYILSHAELPQKYKDKIARLYLSPDDIMELVAKLEEKNSTEKQEELIKEETDIVEEINAESNS